jgi:hypothetical protein
LVANSKIQEDAEYLQWRAYLDAVTQDLNNQSSPSSKPLAPPSVKIKLENVKPKQYEYSHCQVEKEWETEESNEVIPTLLPDFP